MGLRKPGFLTLLGLVLAGFLSLNGAEVPKGELGSSAPALQTEAWFNGKAVELAPKGGTNLCVLTFFETWCDSCMAAFPRLIGLKSQFEGRGVVFLGVSAESTEAVKSFAESTTMKSQLNFPIAADRGQATYNAYMNAFERKNVPCSFIINPKGEILWCGPPLAGLEQAIDQILGGTFDLKAAKKAAAAEKLTDAYFQRVSDESFQILSGNDLTTEELGTRIVSDGAANPWLLNNFAWKILTDQRIKTRDLALAERASKLASELDKTGAPSFADTYARALFQRGKISQAIQMQKHAIQLCKDSQHRMRLEQTLAGYEEGLKSSSKP